MKPFWVGCQLALGVIAACLAIPAALLFVGLANRAPQLWNALLVPLFVGAVTVVMAAIRKAKHS